MSNITVLLVEDHQSLAETVTDFLELAEITVDYAADGITGLHLAVTNHYDALILDVMLPGIEGFEICQKVRKEVRSDVPIIMLTARDQIDDKLTGFDSGADDYLVKPFNPDELVARVKSLVRRHRGEFDQSALQVGDLVFDLATMQVKRGNEVLKVSPTGMQILKVLMKKSPEVVTKEQLTQQLWGDLVPESDVLRSHLYLLRKTIDKPFDKELLHTIPGVGLKMADE
jgi:Response regulators consisting of a CheY-like receiver domain and a winged-helix DNA-binding domain